MLRMDPSEPPSARAGAAGPWRVKCLVGGFRLKVQACLSAVRITESTVKPFGPFQGDSYEIRIRPFRTSFAVPT